ncbi:hypothetical protein [Rasiella sp. SM2506]|uniref:hypothetical protein n=1 Tax=Rasiella sp. SM2506 TaxID=3423914 RepID=UPI003D7B7DA0
MVRCFFLIAFMASFGLPQNLRANSSVNEEIDSILVELYTTIVQRTAIFEIEQTKLENKLQTINHTLQEAQTTEGKINLLLAKDIIKEQIALETSLYLSDIAKIRYLKGLQIIKILYEKTLSLDHHFSSVATLNEISKISNPNNYSEFQDVKKTLVDKRDKKSGFNISTLLGNNIYTSVIHSFVSLFTSNTTSVSEKEANLKNVECILDFTLRMHNDLNTIYFETAFLQKSNESIMTELEQLFKDYTQPIKYKTALKECRENDDWSIIGEELNTYLDTLNATITAGDKPSKVRTMQINLQFPIDRLLQFITQYNAFIDQGSKFYEKFGIMLSSYENEKQCANKIPIEYQNMKKNVALSIEKFNTAYKPIEINGSKLKQLLYGISEYD